MDALADHPALALIALPLNFVDLQTSRPAGQHFSVARSAKKLESQMHGKASRMSLVISVLTL
jgi:hypothetical protein